jgi:predicted enzyme related to lactoylglutathione lyase
MKPIGVILFVTDVEQLKLFYTAHFQFTVAEEIKDEWALLKSGAFEMGLHKAGITQPAKENNGENNNAKFLFETSNDIFQLQTNLISKGMQLQPVETWDGYAYWVCNGTDPEGNVFQIRKRK